MGKRVIIIITESDYRAVLQFDDDGGFPGEVCYEIIPDRLPNVDPSVAKKLGKLVTDKDKYQVRSVTEKKIA